MSMATPPTTTRGTNVRFAISAVAAVSGLFLLGLAFYGQPALYLHQAREQWDALIDSPGADQSAEPDRDAAADRAARLQQQVARLEHELAARRARTPQTASVDNQAPPVPPTAPQPEAAPVVAAQPAPPQPTTPQPTTPQPMTSQPSAPQIAAAQPPAPNPDVIQRRPPDPQTTQFAAVDPAVPAPRVTTPAPDAASSAIAIPERRNATADEPSDSKPEPARRDAAKPDNVKAEPARPEPAKPPPQKLTLLKPAPAPPPPPSQPSAASPDTDDAQSVLARLRQLGPAAAPPQPALPTPPMEPKPRPAPSPSLSRLTAARAALASGRVEDARRLLQEAQLQLVFRPVNAAGDDSPAAGKGAADVAHALDALSANDVPLSRRYIDIALDDLSGSATNPPVQETQVRPPSGYAPAYPPR
jgi:hypothetical protein